MKTKICIYCKEVKPLTDEYFYLRKETNKFHNSCFVCENARKMKDYYKNRKQRLEKQKEWREKNPNCGKQHYQNNIEYHRNYTKSRAERRKVDNSQAIRKEYEKQFIQKSITFHNGKYDYSKVNYRRTDINVKIICSEHGLFWQRPNNHLHGNGCSKCANQKFLSIGANKILELLKKKKLRYELEKSFKDCINLKTNELLFFDFYIPYLNLLIEYDGKQHFNKKCFGQGEKELKYIQYKDQLKTNYCKKKGINLLRIPYWEISNIEVILQNYFIQLKQAA